MHTNRDITVLGFCFSWCTNGAIDPYKEPLFEFHLGSSTHNNGTHVTQYRFAPYFFLHIGRQSYGLDWEWFPRRREWSEFPEDD